MRGKKNFKRHSLSPDPKYQSVLLSRFANYLMRDGKKNTAYNILYEAMSLIEHKTKKPALQLVEQAIQNAKPLVEVKSKRIGGATYQVPIEVRPDRQTQLALRWFVQAERQKHGAKSSQLLAQELIDAANKTGGVIGRRDTMHKMAEANRAFAHYARF